MLKNTDQKGAFDEFIKERTFSIRSMEQSLRRTLTEVEKLDFTENMRSAFKRTYS